MRRRTLKIRSTPQLLNNTELKLCVTIMEEHRGDGILAFEILMSLKVMNSATMIFLMICVMI